VPDGHPKSIRDLAYEAGLLLDIASPYRKFVLDLDGSTVVIPADVRCLIRLVELAAEAHGPHRGGHRELLDLVARREDLDEEAGEARPDIVFWLDADDPKVRRDPSAWIRLGTWLEDQIVAVPLILKAFKTNART
jgi:hypothetical protein